jgi:crotonobetainyl-CoA:carnitine CoA-transferase CaiB-like acyl-CoA transferase
LHPNIAPYGEVFNCADGGRIILAVGSDAQFKGLCEVLQRTDLITDPCYDRNVSRVQHRKELADELSTVIGSWVHTDLLTALEKAGVPSGAVNSIDVALNSTAAQAMILEQVIDGQPTRRIRGNAFRLESY